MKNNLFHLPAHFSRAPISSRSLVGLGDGSARFAFNVCVVDEAAGLSRAPRLLIAREITTKGCVPARVGVSVVRELAGLPGTPLVRIQKITADGEDRPGLAVVAHLSRVHALTHIRFHPAQRVGRECTCSL